ncbi:MAG: outer membrane protein assembly factor BamD [Planctomycetes bacterium]|nr:outer membrane protein assembly factor BamD [Planctomycetota bacterium]
MKPLILLCLLTLCLGCTTPLGEGDLPILEVPTAEAPAATSDGEAQARSAFQVGRFSEAGSAYFALAQLEADPQLRAEFLFLSAECALGEGNHYLAYFRYARLLKLYPGTARYAHSVDRLFLIGRLYCEGKATKPSWLFGIAMRDLEFGIEALERFQRERERHRSADDALHYVALAYEELRNEELAIDAWSKLRRFYKESEWAETAQYRGALAEIARSEGVRYDKQPLLAGLILLERYAAQHPKGNHVSDALAKAKELRELLAGQLLRTARFYASAGEPYSTQLYLTAIERDYPQTEAASQAQAFAKSVSKAEAPAAPPAPEDLEPLEGINEDRLRIAPPPLDDAW